MRLGRIAASLLYETLDVDGVNPTYRSFGARDFHDVSEMIGYGESYRPGRED